MKVLHDWDEIPLRVDWARKRGISLLAYCLANKFPILKKIQVVSENSKRIELEKLEYMETLAKLDYIAEIKPIYGIRPNVRKRYHDDIELFRSDYDLDVRIHTHVGDPPNKNRLRFWFPPLSKNVSRHFDTEYIAGKRGVAGESEFPVFHVDYPYQLKNYIDYIYEVMKNDK